MTQFIKFFIFLFFLLLFNFENFESYELNEIADKNEEQFIIDEDLLIVKNLNDGRILNQRKSYSSYDTTMELGSGSPETTITSTPFTTTYYNSTITTFITELVTSEPSSYFTSETSGITEFSTEFSSVTQSSMTSFLTTVINSTEPSSSIFTSESLSTLFSTSQSITELSSSTLLTSYQTNELITELESSTLPTTNQTSQSITELSSSTLLTSYQTNEPITELESSTLLTKYQTSQVTSQRLIVSTNNYTSTGEQTTSFFNSTIISTTALPGLLRGNQDESLLPTWIGFTNYSSYSISLNDDQIPLILMSQSFTNLAIHPNGYISLGNSIFNAQFPTSSVTKLSIPIISPFWFSSYFSSDSDITYGRYDSTNMDFNLQQNVLQLINNRPQQSRSISRITPSTIDVIYIITWKNLHFYSSDNNQKATFQLILATSVTTERTFALFNYPRNGINWNNNDVTVFIGYTSGLNDNVNTVNMYSNSVKTRSIPSLIYSEKGNTNQIGLFVYDLRYGGILDDCTNWYYNQISSSSSNQPNGLVKCPTNAIAALTHPYYILYTGKIWQSNSICFQLNTQVFYGKKKQQFCCYDYKNFNLGSLITDGFNAGFVYNSKSFNNIMKNGLTCCLSGSKGCRLFYKIYPPSIIKRSQKIRIASGTGDPQITTFDGLSYSFGGYGRFLLSKANDNSFEIQAETSIFSNINDSSITGTLFNAFAIKTDESMTFEFRMNTNIQNAPSIDIYVNKSNQALSIQNPLNYYSDFNCLTNISIICNSIFLNGSNNVQVIFFNGLIVNFQIFTARINQQENIAWMGISIAFFDTISNYESNVNGLLGNNNDQTNDDIASRTGSISSDTTTDSVIYNYANTWKLIGTDSSLFYQSQAFKRFKRQATSSSYQPSFLQSIINKNPSLAQQANLTCNYNAQCVSAYLTSGLADIGQQTRSSIQANQNLIAVIALNPPSISFRNSTVNIDWSISNNKIIIIADVFSFGNNVLASNSIVLNILNANNLTNVINYVNSSYAVVTFTYYPSIGEYPIFQITATDSQNLTNTIAMPQTLICNCKSLDSDNTCLFNSLLSVINPYTAIVACSCNQYYKGTYCNETIDYCSLGNWCTLYPGFNTNITCSSYNVSMQKQTGFGYQCIGTCSSGFSKNKFGACQDLDECSNNTICPLNSNCVNQIGSYTCKCNEGYIYKDNQCKELNLCTTSQNNCDSICNPDANGFTCSCYYGYTLNTTTTSCQKSLNINISGCETSNCPQMCSLNSTNNQSQCYCYLGYNYNSVTNKCDKINQCQISNGGCSTTCNNQTGSGTYYYNSFYCSCNNGYYLDTDYSSCIECPYGKYGINCNETCQCLNSLSCSNTDGCICNVGFTDKNCSTAIDLCQNLSITYNKTTTDCISESGYYQLICLPGYYQTSLNQNCTKYDYCQIDLCPASSACSSLNTTYTCSCSSGLSYDSTTNNCKDVNECLSPLICSNNTVCQNTEGNYYCACQSGYYNTNQNITFDKQPICADINECTFSNALCPANQTCNNTVGSYQCLCSDGSIATNGQCSSTLNETTTQTTPVAVGLILSIVLPIGIVLVLSILAAIVCYFWFKIRAEKLKTKSPKPNEAKKINTDSKWPFEKSMFQREDLDQDDDIDSNYLNTFQENYNDILNGANQDKIRSIYRSIYPSDDLNNKSDPNFFKSLEDKMRSNQHTTITRPHSIFSDSISLPTAYYETTTPYLTQNSFPQFISSLDEIPIETNEIFENNNLDYDDDLNKDNFEDLFDNDADIGVDFIEAYNPNVKIPRPKLQLNPMKLFNLKLGPKQGESEQ